MVSRASFPCRLIFSVILVGQGGGVRKIVPTVGYTDHKTEQGLKPSTLEQEGECFYDAQECV